MKWATCNVGASKPEEYGDYFAWGEVEPYYNGDSQNPTDWKSGKTEGYSWSSYKYCKGEDYDLTKYCNNSSDGYNGYTDKKTFLDPEDDAAHMNWGGSWRMPTKAELEELQNTNNCTWTWTTINDLRQDRQPVMFWYWQGSLDFLKGRFPRIFQGEAKKDDVRKGRLFDALYSMDEALHR